MRFELDFYTQYCQFYILGRTELTDLDENGYEERLGVFHNLLVVYTECYGPIKGEVTILEKASDIINYSLYDHIVEAGLEVINDKLQILDCPNNSLELEIPIESGLYRVRVYSSNLATVDGDEGEDFYKIEIWKDNNLERKLLKKYTRK